MPISPFGFDKTIRSAFQQFPPSEEDGPKAVIKQGRRRYWYLHLSDRPRLDQPQNLLVLFSQPEFCCLVGSGYWPLPEKAIAFISEPPQERRSKKQRLRRLIAAASEKGGR